MINREMKTVEVLTYTEVSGSTDDERGIPRRQGSTSRNVEMMMKIYSQRPTDGIRYADVEMIGITKDSAITDKNTIKSDGNTYQILYVIPSGKYNQILMKKQ